MIQYKCPGLCIFESALFRTTTTVAYTDDLVLIVDPNWLPSEIKEIQRFVDEVKGDRELFLLFTHSDYDHIIGYGAFPDAKVIASKAFANNAEAQKQLDLALDFDDEYYIGRDYKLEYPRVDIEIKKDGQGLRIGDTKVIFYLSPGHNADGLFCLLKPGGIWIAGDYLSNVEFPFIYHNSSEYLNSLEKARELIQVHRPRILIPGHGDVENSRALMLKRVEASEKYIQALRGSIEKGIPFPVNDLWEKYKFKKSLTKCHQENEKLLKEELF